MLHYIENKPAYIFSTNSTSASEGAMDPQCLIYLDSVWSGSKLIQTAGPEIWVREGGYSTSEMRAFKWNMNSSQSEWIPIAPQSRKKPVMVLILTQAMTKCMTPSEAVN